MTTSLMNTLLTKLMLKWALESFNVKYSMCVEGDDSIVGLSVKEDISTTLSNRIQD